MAITMGYVFVVKKITENTETEQIATFSDLLVGLVGSLIVAIICFAIGFYIIHVSGAYDFGLLFICGGVSPMLLAIDSFIRIFPVRKGLEWGQKETIFGYMSIIPLILGLILIFIMFY